MKPDSIISKFKLKNKFLNWRPIEVGHINDTFLIYTEYINERYILQRINRHVFKNIPELINNILLATKHIAGKIDANPKDDLLREKVELIQTTDGNYFYRDLDGDYWRLYNFVEGVHYDVNDDPYKAYQSGKALGKFQSLLSDLSAGQLSHTIPHFHHMKARYNSFLASVEKNPRSRVKEVQEEIGFVESHIRELIAMQELIDEGRIPVRITHNDTKLNNILFDKNNIPVCIVDLDTVMPGSVLYDFGDAIRTGTNTGAEDEDDLSKVTIDIKLFDAYTKGYLETAKSFLIPAEIENLPLAAKYITFIMGLRFLTDYLDGDTYYKIHFTRHNLYRTKAQFKLVESINEQYGEMKSIVNKYASNNENVKQ